MYTNAKFYRINPKITPEDKNPKKIRWSKMWCDKIFQDKNQDAIGSFSDIYSYNHITNICMQVWMYASA